MTEEVQVTSLSTYLPVTSWDGSSKQLGGCKQELLYCWFTQRNVSQCRLAQSVSKHESDLFFNKNCFTYCQYEEYSCRK
jgi:hypothetical protein